MAELGASLRNLFSPQAPGAQRRAPSTHAAETTEPTAQTDMPRTAQDDPEASRGSNTQMAWLQKIESRRAVTASNDGDSTVWTPAQSQASSPERLRNAIQNSVSPGRMRAPIKHSTSAGKLSTRSRIDPGATMQPLMHSTRDETRDDMDADEIDPADLPVEMHKEFVPAVPSAPKQMLTMEDVCSRGTDSGKRQINGGSVTSPEESSCKHKEEGEEKPPTMQSREKPSISSSFKNFRRRHPQLVQDAIDEPARTAPDFGTGLGSAPPPGWEEPRVSLERWHRLEYRLGVVSPSTHVAEGDAGHHVFGARIEASRKLIGNRQNVLRDITRADGPPPTQRELVRLPGQEAVVDAALYELARRLVGRRPGERTRRMRPANTSQAAVWQAAMKYLNARLQSTTQEVAKVSGHENRKPDMSPAAAAAMRAVIFEIGYECSGGTWAQGDDDRVCSAQCQEEFAHTVSWVTMILFALGALILLILFGTLDTSHPEPLAGTFAVCAIAACAYLAKNTGMGEMTIYGTKVPIARYVDWIVTTPLMLYELCHLGGADSATTLVVIVADILMLATGIFAACLSRVDHSRLMLVWFSIGCFFYVVMVVILHTKVAQTTVKDQDKDTQDLFHYLEYLTLSTWSFYPVVVFLGRAQFQLISKSMEDTLLCILDCVAKLGMEGLIVVWAVFVFDHDSASSSVAH